MTNRKITGREIAQGDDAKMAAKIAIETHHGNLEGVEVDFRHDLLPLGDWEARVFWDVWGDSADHAGLIFPKEAAFGIETLRDRKSMPKDSPEIFVYEGDKLFISRVEINKEDQPFDHQHDSQTRLAYLQIQRANGDLIDIEKPLTFYGSSQIRNGATRSTFDNIVDRICRHNVLSELPPMVRNSFPPIWSNPPEKIALIAVEEAHRAYFELLDGLPDSLDEQQRVHVSVLLRQVANDASLAGYALGKIEAEAPTKTAIGVRRGGQKGAAANRNDQWEIEAKRLWKEYPKWTLNRVADTIDGHSGLEKRSILRSKAVRAACPESSPSYGKTQKRD